MFLGVVPAVYQSLVVNPNQLSKESPYLARNLAATRTGFDLTSTSETPYSFTGDLSAAALQASAVTVLQHRLRIRRRCSAAMASSRSWPY